MRIRFHQFIHLCFFSLSIYLTYRAFGLWWAFKSRHTEMFVQVHLKDPSLAANQAGYWFGLTIAFLFLLGMVWGTALFLWEVILQIWGTESVAQEWAVLGPLLQNGETTEDEALQRLQARVRAGSRVGTALHSWSDASPFSDAEMVIEGRASSCRQQLGVLQTLASVLVLVGLVGNFFGLAEAVQRLPDLAGSSVTTPGSAPTPSTHESEQPFGDGLTRRETSESQKGATGPVSDLSNMKENVTGISDGLSVVVVSSILGIGGMIFLLLYVSMFKALYNWQVTRECVLLAAEIGSALRPLHGVKGGGPEAPLPVEALERLVTTLVQFQPALLECSATVGHAREDVVSLAGALEKLLKEDLQRANQASTSNREAFEAFCQALSSQSKEVIRSAEATQGLGEQLKQLAENQGRLAADTDQAFRHYNALLAAHEQYVKNSERAALESFKELPQTMRTEMAAVTTKIVEELRNSTAETLGVAQEALRETRQAMQETRQQFVSGYDRLNAGYEDLFRQLHRDLESSLTQGAQKTADAALQSVTATLTPMTGLLDALEKQRLNLEKEGSEALRQTILEVKSLVVQAQGLQQSGHTDMAARLAEVAHAAAETGQGITALARAASDLSQAARELPQAMGQRSGLTADELAQVMDRSVRSLKAKLNELKTERVAFWSLPAWWPGRRASGAGTEEQ